MENRAKFDALIRVEWENGKRTGGNFKRFRIVRQTNEAKGEGSTQAFHGSNESAITAERNGDYFFVTRQKGKKLQRFV